MASPYFGGGCNNGLRTSGISIGWMSSALLACHAITWENGYFRNIFPNDGLRFLGTIQVNLCGTCGLGIGLETGGCGC